MDNLMDSGGTMCTAKVTLAAGTTTTISNTGAIPYCIKGKAYSRAAMTNQATPTTDFATNAAFRPIVANQGTIVVIGLDAGASTVRAAQGSIEALDVAGNFVRAPQLPTLPDTMCPIGYVVLRGGATLVSTFTFGTNNLSGVTGMTYTFGDLMQMPPRPILS